MILKLLKIIGIGFILIMVLGGVFIYMMNSNFKKLGHVDLVAHSAIDTIPFRYSNSGHILIDVSFENGNKTYPFLLDSGASNMIFKKHISGFDLESNGYALGIGSNGSVFWSVLKKMEQLKIGNLNFSNIHFKSVDLNLDCLEAYGIVGIGIMRHSVWQIDFDKKIIIISDEIHNQNIGRISLQFDLSENKYGHQLSIPLKLSQTSGSLRATVDLGNNSNLSLNENRLLKDSLNHQVKRIYGRGSSGLGDSAEDEFDEKLYLIETLVFPGSEYEIHDFPVMAGPGGLNLLGLGFFKNYKTTISWKDKKLIIEPNDSIQNFKWKTSGFSTRFNEEKAIIGSVIENSPASNLELLIGKEVISINDIEIFNEKDYCEMQAHIKEKDTLTIKMKHLDTIRNIQVIKQPIF